MRRAALMLALVLVLAGCGGEGSAVDVAEAQAAYDRAYSAFVTARFNEPLGGNCAVLTDAAIALARAWERLNEVADPLVDEPHESFTTGAAAQACPAIAEVLR
jgi:hypothetical protein